MLATEESSQGALYLCHDVGGAPDRTRDLRQTIKHYQDQEAHQTAQEVHTERRTIKHYHIRGSLRWLGIPPPYLLFLCNHEQNFRFRGIEIIKVLQGLENSIRAIRCQFLPVFGE